MRHLSALDSFRANVSLVASTYSEIFHCTQLDEPPCTLYIRSRSLILQQSNSGPSAAIHCRFHRLVHAYIPSIIRLSLSLLFRYRFIIFVYLARERKSRIDCAGQRAETQPEGGTRGGGGEGGGGRGVSFNPQVLRWRVTVVIFDARSFVSSEFAVLSEWRWTTNEERGKNARSFAVDPRTRTRKICVKGEETWCPVRTRENTIGDDLVKRLDVPLARQFDRRQVDKVARLSNHPTSRDDTSRKIKRIFYPGFSSGPD